MSAGQARSPNGVPGGFNIEEMFHQILHSVQKNEAVISTLKQECHELRLANASLERMVKDSLQADRHLGTPGFATPAPGSPHIRARSPFLAATIPRIETTGPNHPSPLGENALNTYPFRSDRDIPGFYVVIPAGGAGTRLWPLSREDHPKFLLDLTLKGRSLIQATWDRLIPLSSSERTTVVAGPAHVATIAAQLPDLLPENIFCEPGPKDSMAAIGLASAILARRDPDAVIGSFAADHMISGDDMFLSAVAEAVIVAREGFLVTIGIAPMHPSTGFGYIRLGEKLDIKGAPNSRMVPSFKEKPDARTAASYIASGNYHWNAGMFVTKATTLMNLLAQYKPELAAGLETIAAAWDLGEEQRQAALAEIWPKLEKIPIDNAIAEPAALEGKVAVVPSNFGWDDVGDFSSLAGMLPAEPGRPAILGETHLVVSDQAAGGFVVPGSGRLITTLGVDDLVIVDMPDTLLVTTRARSQEVKRIVKKTKEAGFKHLL